jgi:hypothetical protein
MAEQVFAYIAHKEGKADDTAVELATAAGKIYPDAGAIAIVTGSGSDLDAVCNEVAAFYKEVWKFDNDALSYPNAEAVRKLLVDALPRDAVVLLAHDTFGMDLGPGLAIKLDSAFISDVVDFEGLEGDLLKVPALSLIFVRVFFKAMNPGPPAARWRTNQRILEILQSADVFLKSLKPKSAMSTLPKRTFSFRSVAGLKTRIISKLPMNWQKPWGRWSHVRGRLWMPNGWKNRAR